MPRPHFSVLLATYDGERFIREQLSSVARQSRGTIDLHASDDGSPDRTKAVLDEVGSAWSRGRYFYRDGPRAGYSENFRSLLCRPEVAGDYVAFCDQDDVWEPDKFAAAVAALEEFGARPALYCSRTTLVDEQGRRIGESPLFRTAPGFRNAIVQSIAGGNTMVMNRAAFDLVAESARRTGFVSHDWWCYILVTAAGGEVVYDPRPRVLYRQHEANLIGKNRGAGARLKRLKRLAAGDFSSWLDRNLASLDACADLLTEDAREVIASVRIARDGKLPDRLRALARSGVHRQTRSDNIALYIAAFLGRL